MKVKYIGRKEQGCGVMLPIGCKHRSAMRGTMHFEHEGVQELSDAEAQKLVKLDPYNFELVDHVTINGVPTKFEDAEEIGVNPISKAGTEIHTKKRARKPKEQHVA